MARSRVAGWLLAMIAGLPVVAAAQAPAPQQARVAVAANFADAARMLAGTYAKQSGHSITISSASTGKLYAQIKHGAPFDVLLAADDTTPRKLVDEGLADAATLHDYAIGRLVLWSRDPQLVKRGEALLRDGRIERLAIANPELAPYGMAAREVLIHLGRWDALQPALVLGENVGQTTQFVMTGAAPLGLLPRSLVLLAAKQGTSGSGWEIPTDWYRPIVQSAVLLEHGKHNAAARGFLDYLKTPAARQQIHAFGYD